MKSLSRGLLLALTAVVVIGGAVSGAVAWHSSRIEIGELFDAKLAHSARVLQGLAAAGLLRSDATVEIPLWAGEVHGHGVDLQTRYGHGYETRLAFQVFDAEGRLLMRSDNAPQVPVATRAPGFADSSVDGVRWRAFVLIERGRWYIAAERADVRAEIAADITRSVVVPLLVELPITVLLIGLAIGIGRRALRRVTDAVQARAADHLAPLDVTGVPEEVSGLVVAINGLLGELDATLARERRFTADAAHELRTPIAGLKVQLANLRDARDDDERAHAQRQLARGLERLERLVAQMLTLARLDPDAGDEGRRRVDLASVCREVITELADSNRLDGVEFDFNVVGTPVVHAEPVALASLVRNLLDNALRHAGQPARVAVALAAVDAGSTLVVEDAGAGIPAESRERVLERFHRLPGSGEGAGLGLSIVRRVVEAHGGRLTLGASAALGGLRVEVFLPEPRR